MAHHLETLHWKRQLDADSIKDLLLAWQARDCYSMGDSAQKSLQLHPGF